MTTTVLRAARRYTERGWPVFLLGRAKRPVANCRACRAASDHDPAQCECLTCHGFYAATTDPDRVTAMIDRIPRGLLAIRTGTASGLFIVDIDPRNGGTLDLDLMTPTAIVATGGGGWHLYYALDQPTKSGKLRPGIDIKADGGYVVAPPATHPGTGRPYRWASDRPIGEMPRALADAYQAATATPAPDVAEPADARPVRLTGGAGISNPTALLKSILAAVERAQPGTRRYTLYGAARGVARMVAAGVLGELDAIDALTHTGRRAEQTDRDIRAAIVGGFRAEHVPLTPITNGAFA